MEPLPIGLGIIVLANLAVGWVALSRLSRPAPQPPDTISPQIEELATSIERLDSILRAELSAGRTEDASLGRNLREEVGASLERMRTVIDERLHLVQVENAKKLEEMRQTVDERLQGTLERRLGESFQMVSERLEQVHRGLGEMQALATGVGDLKRVLTNVATRGTWGEVQLGSLLEQILTAEQYEKNVITKVGSAERVEFAIRLPGRDHEGPVWLPIDAKFPLEDYQRLVAAAERSDAEGVEASSRALETRMRLAARDIHTKYVDPPATTDFAVLFLPTEGLYAEVLRRPGLVEGLQRDYRVNVAGPTTLAALLNSLQMGFHTLAIERRTSDVWKLLGAVKTEFGRFGDVLDKVDKKLQEASNTIESAKTRTRVIQRKLKDVQDVPAPALDALEAGDEDDEEAADESEPQGTATEPLFRNLR